ncbi:MAG: hypothetical protein WAP52_01785 [Candidatus Sungiibacteriota bacterium]
MQLPITIEYLAEILQKMAETSSRMEDPVKTQFGDPFSRLTAVGCQRIANAIMAGTAGYTLLNERGSVILTWTKVNSRLRLALSGQSEHYARIITAVHEYFKKEGLMESLNLVH